MRPTASASSTTACPGSWTTCGPRASSAAALRTATPNYSWAATRASGARTMCCAPWPALAKTCRATSSWAKQPSSAFTPCPRARCAPPRSEEHTSELQSPCNLVCRLLLEKKKTHACAQQPVPTPPHAGDFGASPPLSAIKSYAATPLLDLRELLDASDQHRPVHANGGSRA